MDAVGCRMVIVLWSLLAVVGVGCRTRVPEVQPEVVDAITQAGLISDLAAGRYGGFFPVTNLVRYGDHGLGTFDRLDGEMILVSGTVYRAAADGAITVPPESNDTPFAVVTWFSPDRMFDVENINYERFRKALDMRNRLIDVPQAIQVHGVFRSMTIRSVPAQDQQPWMILDEVLEHAARTRRLTDVAGVMVGYYYPDPLASLHPSGYHLHFIDHGRQVGGHVLDFELSQARILIDHSPFLRIHLPTNQVRPAMSRPVVLPRPRP